MPAMRDDRARAPSFLSSGAPPYPTATSNPIPPAIAPRCVTLRDRISTATLLPFSSAAQVPPRLVAHLADQFNREIELGDTYPMMDPMGVEQFGGYWFQNFGAIVLLGELAGDGGAREGEVGGAVTVEAAIAELAASSQTILADLATCAMRDSWSRT